MLCPKKPGKKGKEISKIRIDFRSHNTTLPIEKEREFQEMLKVFNENFNNLNSENPAQFCSACDFMSHLFSFGRPDVLFANQRTFETLISVVFSFDNALWQASAMRTLLAFIKLTGFALSYEVCEAILGKIGALSPPLEGLKNYAAMLFLLLNVVLLFLLILLL